MDKYRFGEFIYNQRKKLGFTQDELGRKLKVTNKAVSKWETGETLPDIQLLEDLARVLNVTLDELLTGVKPEAEKVEVDYKKKERIILFITSIIFFITTISLLFVVISSKKDIKITEENYQDYFLVTPCEESIADGYGMTINGSIKTLAEVEDASLTLNFTIQYFYFNTNNELSEILYVDRIISYDELVNDFSIIVKPKSQITNFKEFYGFTISYEIEEVNGTVTK
jgi:transcriptional regulator with XRE-family HTH domain